jgi:hypothetical protein
VPITEEERAALAAEFPHWHVWRHNGLIYARRLKTSPPPVKRAASAEELRVLIQAVERGG